MDNTGVTQIYGNVGTNSVFEGFDPMTLDGTREFSSSPIVVGASLYAPYYLAPTPEILDAAVDDMEAAYTVAFHLHPYEIFSVNTIFEPNYVPYKGVTKFTDDATLPADR